MSWAWLIVLLSGMQVPSVAQENPLRNSPGLLEVAAAKGIGRLDSGSGGVFIYTFTRGAERRDSLVLTAGTAFESDVLRVGASSCVSLMAAMPFNLGDGAVLTITIEDGERRQPAVQLVLDPAHVRAHRAWLPLRFEIPAGLNGFRLRLEVGSGIRGDATGDWVGLAEGSEPGCLFTALPKE